MRVFLVVFCTLFCPLVADPILSESKCMIGTLDSGVLIPIPNYTLYKENHEISVYRSVLDPEKFFNFVYEPFDEEIRLFDYAKMHSLETERFFHQSNTLLKSGMKGKIPMILQIWENWDVYTQVNSKIDIWAVPKPRG